MREFIVSDSIFSYFSDAAISTAVNHLLDAKTSKVPSDLDWKDITYFHKAVQSAHQIRCEHATLLVDLWDAIWAPCIDNAKNKLVLKVWSIKETQEQACWQFDPAYLWDNAWFGKYFDIENSPYIVCLGIYLSVDDGIQISLDIEDKNNSPCTNAVNLDGIWQKEDIEENTIYTRQKALLIKKKIIELFTIQKAAKEAILQLQLIVSKP